MVNTEEQSTVRVREDAEPQHQGREALENHEEVRPDTAEWASFQRTCCVRCRCC